MSNQQSEHGEDFHRSFQEFMITGRKASTPQKHGHPRTPSKTPQSSTPKSTTPTTVRKAATNLQSQINTFYRCLVQDWLDTDDHLAEVVDSISNLRYRLYVVSRRFCTLEKVDETDPRSSKKSQTPVVVAGSNNWNQYGFRSSGGSRGLILDDLQIALDHSLQAHERMLTALRQGMAQLAQAQDALGRRLDTLVVSDTPTAASTGSPAGRTTSLAASWSEFVIAAEQDDQNRTWDVLQSLERQLDECHELYRATAVELHRKQLWAYKITDESFHDGLLWLDSREVEDPTKQDAVNPQTVAQQAAAAWPRRTNKESPLYPLKSLCQRLEGEFK